MGCSASTTGKDYSHLNVLLGKWCWVTAQYNQNPMKCLAEESTTFLKANDPTAPLMPLPCSSSDNEGRILHSGHLLSFESDETQTNFRVKVEFLLAIARARSAEAAFPPVAHVSSSKCDVKAVECCVSLRNFFLDKSARGCSDRGLVLRIGDIVSLIVECTGKDQFTFTENYRNEVEVIYSTVPFDANALFATRDEAIRAFLRHSLRSSPEGIDLNAAATVEVELPEETIEDPLEWRQAEASTANCFDDLYQHPKFGKPFINLEVTSTTTMAQITSEESDEELLIWIGIEDFDDFQEIVVQSLFPFVTVVIEDGNEKSFTVHYSLTKTLSRVRIPKSMWKIVLLSYQTTVDNYDPKDCVMVRPRVPISIVASASPLKLALSPSV